MFIKPIDISLLPTANWTDRAVNNHFVLQSKKSNTFQSLFTNLSLSQNLKAIADFQYRILLKLKDGKKCVVSVDETFEKCHLDWNWVESNLFLKLMDLESNSQANTQLDMALLKQFEEMTEEATEIVSSTEFAKLNQLRIKFYLIFPELDQEVLLNGFNCTYIASEILTVRGQLFISRNYVSFHTSESEVPKFSMSFKDITSLDIVPSKRVLLPDGIEFGIANRKHVFALFFLRRELFRIIAALCNSAMHKLIKGAETAAFSSEADLKSTTTGDLGNTIQKGKSTLGESVDFPGILEEYEEGSFISQDILFSPDNGKYSSDIPKAMSNFNFQAFAHIDPAYIQSTDELEKQVKYVEFRKLFLLNLNDIIIEEEQGLYYLDRVTNTAISGNLYFSRNCIHFASTQAPNLSLTNSKIANQISCIPSSLFESANDCIFNFSIPPSQIVSLKKVASPPPGAKMTSFAISGFLVINIKSDKPKEFWLSSSSLKIRDRIYDTILQRIKSIDIQEEDFKIGIRNGTIIPQSKIRLSIYSTTEASHLSLDSGLINGAQNSDSGLEDVMQNIGVDDGVNISIFVTPLKLIFPSVFTPPQNQNDPEFVLWEGFLDINGRDQCLVKNVKSIRELLTKTCGVPSQLRGDFWLIVSGAWYSRPEKDYYAQLLRDHFGKLNPFEDEIEKDVRRSLPEHTAFQSVSGLGALRRILVSYSFRNPGIGYAQALNIISAILLLNLKEEDAFWMLCTIVEKIVPNHYTKTLVGSVVDQQVFTVLLKQFMPAITSHMEKYHMELSTFTVPWFVCLFLNTISLKVNPIILDAFFLDGPKFLFWFGLSIMKLNEFLLIKKRDDELFMNVFKDFFNRLAADSENSPVFDIKAAVENQITDETVLKMTGKDLIQYTLWTCYTHFAPHVTNEIMESLRMQRMISVVHQMEDSYKKSQIRNICELVKLSYEEVSIVYQQVRQLEFMREEDDDLSLKDKSYTSSAIDFLIERGGWGLIKNIRPRVKPASISTRNMPKNIVKKAIPLLEFQKVFNRISPWRSPLIVVEKETVKATINPAIGNFRRGSLPNSFISQKHIIPEDYQLPITDRLYFYTAFQQCKTVGPRDNQSQHFMVDLGNMVQILDTIMKQSLQLKLRLLYDMHDLDGDGLLNKNELKAVMDSLLEMFDKIKVRLGQARDEEVYLKAISAFLGVALKSGKGSVNETEEAKRTRMKSKSANGLLHSIGNASGEDGFRLGFHEFLLSVLSQSVFVDFFEKTWCLLLDASGQIQLKPESV